MALYPLCRDGRPAKQGLAYAAGAIMAVTPDTIIRADLLTTLAIFGKLAYGQMDVMSLIGREHMKESALYAEIGDEAWVETAQADVLAVLEERFGEQAAAACSDAVQRLTKQDKLRNSFAWRSAVPMSKPFNEACEGAKSNPRQSTRCAALHVSVARRYAG